MRKKIVWKKFNDPLTRLFDNKKYDKINKDFPPSEGEQDAIDSMINDGSYHIEDTEYIPLMVMTPQGPIPLYEHGLPSKNYNLWVGHTNFKLKWSDLNLLGEVLGVEKAYILTRYRFLVAIALSFDPKEIRQNINRKFSNAKDRQGNPSH